MRRLALSFMLAVLAAGPASAEQDLLLGRGHVLAPP